MKTHPITPPARCVLAAFLAGLLGIADASGQTIVSGGGAALNQAVQAARRDDHLIVRAGNYDSPVIDRGLRIDFDPGVVLQPDLQGLGFVRIGPIPAGDRLILRGGSVQAGSLYSRVMIDHCDGDVVWIGLTLPTASGFGELRVEGSASVAFHAPVFPPAQPRIGNGWGIAVADSTVLVADCPVSAPFAVTRSSLSLRDCQVVQTYNEWALHAEDSQVAILGGDFPGSTFNLGIYDLPGIDLVRSSLWITGGAQVSAGTGVVGLHGAIEGDAASSVRFDPSVQLTAPNAANPIQGGLFRANLVVPALRLAGQVASGTIFPVTVAAAPGDLVQVFVDLPTSALPTPLGPLFVRPGSLILDTYAMPASGAITRTYPMPSLPAAVPLVLQPIRLGANGELAIGPAAPLQIN